MSHTSRFIRLSSVALLLLGISRAACGQAAANPAPQPANIGQVPPPGALFALPPTNGTSTTPTYPDIADAMARADAAKQMYAEAQATVRQVTLAIHKKFDSAPETLQARAELDAATTSLNNLRASVVATLQSDPPYAQLLLEIEHVSGALDPQIGGELADVDRAGLAQAKMEYAARLHHMEEDALDQHPDYGVAVQRLQQASAHWTTIQAQIDAALADDPQLKAAQADVAAAQTNLAAAQAYLQGALLERHDAVRAERMQYRSANDLNNYPFDGGYPVPFYTAPVTVGTTGRR